MNGEQFKKLALRTEPSSLEYSHARDRLDDTESLRLLHAAMGLCTEAAEFLDVMKKYIFYGKSIDKVNLLEELGDSDWYEALALAVLNRSFEEVWIAVINKLSKRYGLEFNVEGAVNRNLEEERESLESDLQSPKVCPDNCEFSPIRHFQKDHCEVEACPYCSHSRHLITEHSLREGYGH